MRTTRRQLLKTGGVTGIAALLNLRLEASTHEYLTLKGRVKHSVCRWCYDQIPLEDLCKAAASIGLKSIELTGPADWPTLKKYGLVAAMANGAEIGLTKGFNDPANHAELFRRYSEMIPKVAAAGFDKLICFSGNRNGMSDELGLTQAAEGLKPLMPLAEKYRVTLVMELLNSKVDHKDYQCDHTAWGAALCEKVGSPWFKLLYDIYHMQIMEGDVIATIRKYHNYIAHYHTGGVPGRHEIDESQELYYPAIITAIYETGFTGFIGQEFIPAASDKIDSLRKGVQICDI